MGNSTNHSRLVGWQFSTTCTSCHHFLRPSPVRHVPWNSWCTMFVRGCSYSRSELCAGKWRIVVAQIWFDMRQTLRFSIICTVPPSWTHVQMSAAVALWLVYQLVYFQYVCFFDRPQREVVMVQSRTAAPSLRNRHQSCSDAVFLFLALSLLKY